MRYLKSFEMNNDTPSNGDYVICDNCQLKVNNIKREFIFNNIGIINNIDECGNYAIIYNDDDFYKNGNYKYFTYFCELKDILYWSNDRNELDMILKSNKFNI